VAAVIGNAVPGIAIGTSVVPSVPSCQAVLEREGVAHPADLAVIGSEEDLAAAVGRYTDAGATEIVITNSGLAGPGDRQRTWRLLGELHRPG
jgi:hypothetical protein